MLRGTHAAVWNHWGGGLCEKGGLCAPPRWQASMWGVEEAGRCSSVAGRVQHTPVLRGGSPQSSRAGGEGYCVRKSAKQTSQSEMTELRGPTVFVDTFAHLG